MKKIFTFGIFLLLLVGIGNNVSANIITAVPGLSTGADWSATTTWVSGVVPTSSDSVVIPANDSIYITANSSCMNLSVSGKLLVKGFSLYANGDVTVNSGGVFNIDKNLYCKNIYNFGRFYAPGRSNSSTSTYVYLGYGSSGSTATASTDSCTIVNNGIFGWNRSQAMASSGSNGCGIILYYSNIAKAVTITTSNGVTSGYIFAIVSMLPANSGIAPTQDLKVYFKETVAFAYSSSSYPGFSLYNTAETTYGYPRTCTIAKGDTVFIAGRFHSYNASASSANQSNMTYNIYGCLDLGTYNRSRNELDLYTTSVAANISSLIVNVGDGTVGNSGSLILGKTINLVKSLTGQTLQINTPIHSTVKFGYTGSAPAFLMTNATFPTALDSLTISTGTYSVPLQSSLRVNSVLKLSSGTITLGTYNLTAGSISGGSSSSYVITSGTGALSTNAATSGTLFPIGTSTGYAPVTITPANNDTISAKVNATPVGTFTGYVINLNEWTLTPQVATTAALAFTPTTATNTTSPVIFSGTGYAATTAATVSGSTFTASGISLAAVATPFATGGTTTPTAVETNTKSNLLVYSTKNSLVVKNAKVGDVVTVYGVSGLKVASSVVSGDNTTLTLTPGIYIVKAGTTVQKVSIQ